MIDKLRQIAKWIKRKIKHILVALGIIGVAFAATQVGTPAIPSVTVNGQTITFPYTDDNTGENLLIYTDKQSYTNGDYIYFAIQNKDIAQVVDIAGFFQKKEYLSDVAFLMKNVPYSVQVPESTTTSYDCSYEEYSTSTGSTTTISRTCERQKITGYHSETRYKDKWVSQPLTDYDAKAVAKFVADNGIKVKDKKHRKAHKKLEIYLPKGFTYFRGKIHAPMMLNKTEFFLEAIGSNKAYGHIDPWLTGWSYRKEISVDPSKIDSDLVDFPVLVKLASSTNFDFSKAKDDGTDIRFTDSSGTTTLEYERERYSTTTGQAEFWVKLPNVSSSSSATTTFYIYYGNSSAADTATTTGVWDSHFMMVQHLQEASTSTGAYIDSTLNGNNGTASSTVSAANLDVVGQIDGANAFDGVDDYIDVPNSDSLNPNYISLSSWIYLNATTGPLQIITKDDYNDTQRVWQYRVYEDKLEIIVFDTNGNAHVCTGNTALAEHQWYFTAGSWDGSTTKVYINGVEDGSLDVSGSLNSGKTNDVGIGAKLNPDPVDFFNGMIDEGRVSDIARSAAWIKATYNSEADTLLTYGTEETAPVAGGRRIIITE